MAAPATELSEIREFALTRLQPVRQDTRHRGGPGHAVRLGRHETPERRREERHRVAGADGVRQHPAQERPQRHRRADRPSAAVAETVQERPDEWGDDRERQHRQAEEQGHLAPGLVGRHLEEQRPGQRDRDRGVPGPIERVQALISRDSPLWPAPSAWVARRAWRNV